MSDLISREAVIEVLKQTGIIQDNDLGHLVVDEINRIPTAYDLDKVVAELEEKRELYRQRCLEAVHKGYAVSSGRYSLTRYCYENAIEIVRKGGV